MHNAILAAAIAGKTVIADTSMTVFFVSVLASMGELWVGFHAAFANVSALILIVWADTQTKAFPQQPPDEQRAYKSPSEEGCRTKQLAEEGRAWSA